MALKRRAYLDFVGKINKHNSTRLLLSTGSIQANSSDHIHTTPLDKIRSSGKFKNLKAVVDNGLGDMKLICEPLHKNLACSPSQR
jgi:hypothetical protein